LGFWFLKLCWAILDAALEIGAAPGAKSIQKSNSLGKGMPKISLGKTSRNSHTTSILCTGKLRALHHVLFFVERFDSLALGLIYTLNSMI